MAVRGSAPLPSATAATAIDVTTAPPPLLIERGGWRALDHLP